MDLSEISTGLRLAEDGIWHAAQSTEVSYPPGGHEAAAALEETSFWFRHRNDCIVSAVKACPPLRGGAIFDVGGGNGFVALGLLRAGFDVAMIEPGPAGAQLARDRGVPTVIRATTESAGFRDESLDAVGLFDVIEHVEDDRAFLGSITRLLKGDGCLYATVPAHAWLWSNEDVLAGHFRRYTLRGLSRVMEAAGLRVVFASYFFRFLVLPIFALRTTPYRLGLARTGPERNPAARDHAAPEGIAGRLLRRLMASEVENIRRRRPMRWGASCLVVARRPA